MSKVLFVFGGEKSSGAEFVIETLIKNFRPADSILVMSPGSFYEELIKFTLPYEIKPLIHLRKLNTKNSSKLKSIYNFLKSIWHINRDIHRIYKNSDIEIIHCNTVVPTFYLLPFAIYSKIFRSRLKFIWSDHDIHYVHKIFNRFLPLIYKFYDKTLVVSNAAAEKYKIRSKVALLYNGLDDKKIINDLNIRKKKREEWAVPDNGIIIGILGQIIERKGVNSFLLDIIELFKSKIFENVYVVIGGNGMTDQDSYFSEFKKLVSYTNKIKYIGYVSDISKFYNGIDILLNNSTLKGSEPLGTTIIEGLAYGKVVVASNVGGSSEIINNGKDGFLFEKETTDFNLKMCLINILNKYNENPQELALIRANARIKFNDKFKINEMVKNYKIILENL